MIDRRNEIVSLLALPVFLICSHSLGAEQSPAWEGRWVQVADSADQGHIITIGAMDIVKCGQKFCGRLVKNGACGPISVRFESDDGQFLEGVLKIEGRSFNTILGFNNDKGQTKSLLVTASEGSDPWSREGMKLGAELVLDGLPRCPATPAS